MDHYKTLGLSRSASKEEIKDAFRKSALKFHPDRHSQSPKEVRDGASLKFKQASEAYEVLIDDRKRADYDFFTRRSSSSSSSSSYSRAYGGGGGGGYGGSSGNYYRAPPRRDVRGGAGGFDFAGVFQHITRRGFLVNLAFASALFGGAVVIERTVQNLWKVNNSGKSFEDTLQTIEKHRRAKTENN